MRSTFWCIMLSKKVSSDSEKVMMHIATKAYLSHTCHCQLARDPHPYVGCVVPVAQNHLNFFGILMDPNYDVV
jgi:hypothetical protein